MVEGLLMAWILFCALWALRITVVGRIQFRALDLTRDIVDAGILNGAIDNIADIDLLYDNLEKRSFFAMIFDLTRWTLRGFYPELHRWEAAHK